MSADSYPLPSATSALGCSKDSPVLAYDGRVVRISKRHAEERHKRRTAVLGDPRCPAVRRPQNRVERADGDSVVCIRKGYALKERRRAATLRHPGRSAVGGVNDGSVTPTAAPLSTSANETLRSPSSVPLFCGTHVAPRSVVRKMVLPGPTAVPTLALANETPWSGRVTPLSRGTHVAPPSVVRRMVPPRPTTVPLLASVNDTPKRAAVTPLSCATHADSPPLPPVPPMPPSPPVPPPPVPAAPPLPPPPFRPSAASRAQHDAERQHKHKSC
jgi:hypothetical protein